MEKTIEIPEGYEARIEGNKVILELNDEKIRSFLYEFIKVCGWSEKQYPPKKRVLAYLEKQKEPLPIPDKFSGLKSLMLQSLQSAANREDDTEIESDTDLWGRKILDYVWKYGERQKEQEPMHFLEIPAGDVAPAEEDSPFDEDEFLDGELSAFLQNYDKEYDDDSAVSDVARHFYEIGKKQKEQKTAVEEVLIKAGLKPFKDGNQWSILVGDNIQEGVCGFGDTIEDALYEFLKEVCEQQKPTEWNDADMRETRQNLISCCRDWERGEKTTLLPVVAVHARYFLEHLTEPQKPAEWSEEDEGMLNCIIATLCEESHGGREANEKMVTWLENRLKSLRPQPHWKPSDRQLGALLTALGDEKKAGSDVATDLRNLHYDLKKYFNL